MFTGIVEDLGEVESVEHLGDFARIHIRSATVSQDARPGDSIAVNGVCLTVTTLIGPAAAGDSGGAGDGGAAGGSAARDGGAGGGADGGAGGSAGRDDGADNSKRPEAGAGAARGFTADVMGETLARTGLAGVAAATRVNLERSVRMQDRLGGHLVQGHVDGTAIVIGREPREHWEVVRVSLPARLARYVVHKGSIAVDGVSLTVSAIAPTPGGQGDAAPSGEAAWFEVSLIPETLKRTTLGFRQPGDLVNLEVDIMAKYVEKLMAGAR